MTKNYQIDGMTCNGCVATVTKNLSAIKGVQNVSVDLAEKEATIISDQGIDLMELQQALGNSKYSIQEKTLSQSSISMHKEEETQETDWQKLYPLFLIFAYLTGTVLLSEWAIGSWNAMRAMQHFMGGFFLVFSFFKLLDLKGFADSFQMYDPLARKFRAYAKVYPFIELGLGIGFLIGFQLWLLCAITLIVLGIGTIGVAKTVLDKKRIQCACLGTVFNLPMTKVTLIENSIMLVMAIGMLISLNTFHS